MELRVNADSIRELSRRIRRESGGAQLRRDMIKEIKAATAPAVQVARSRIRSMPSRGRGRRAGGSLRSKIASKIGVKVVTGGRRPGVRVTVRKGGMPRGFTTAARSVNRSAGWRHPVYGRDVWVDQVGLPGWFDRSMREATPELQRRILGVLQDYLDRIGG